MMYWSGSPSRRRSAAARRAAVGVAVATGHELFDEPARLAALDADGDEFGDELRR